MTDLSIVLEAGGVWVVKDARGEVVSRHATNAAAWAWVDKYGDEGRADADRANRIRNAFAERMPWG